MCRFIFALTMGADFPPYLRWFRPVLTAVPVRFALLGYSEVLSMRTVPERYRPLRVVDRTGMKDLYVDGNRLDVLHLCPTSHPAGSRCRDLTAADAGRQFMLMLLPGEFPSVASLLCGNIVHTMSGEGFHWLGSGDL